MRSLFTTTVVATLLLSSAAAAARPAPPNGTFRNESGMIKLAYTGEGMVSIELATKYCKLVDNSGRAGTFVFPHVAVYDKANAPLLVIFYHPKEIVVFGELERFKKNYCKGGHDVTGSYRRSRK